MKPGYLIARVRHRQWRATVMRNGYTLHKRHGRPWHMSLARWMRLRVAEENLLLRDAGIH